MQIQNYVTAPAPTSSQRMSAIRSRVAFRGDLPNPEQSESVSKKVNLSAKAVLTLMLAFIGGGVGNMIAGNPSHVITEENPNGQPTITIKRDYQPTLMGAGIGGVAGLLLGLAAGDPASAKKEEQEPEADNKADNA